MKTYREFMEGAGGVAPAGNQGMTDANQSTSKRVGDATSTALPSSRMRSKPKLPSAPSSQNIGGQKKVD